MPYDTDDFETDVIQRSHTVPVLVDFWAEWCGPCKIIGPILERLAQQHEDEWALAKLDTDKHQAIAMRYGIRSIPNVKLFVDGEVSDEFVGALPEPRIVEWLRKAVPSKYRAQLEGARQLLLENGASQAEEMLQPLVAAEPDNDQAVVLLGQALLNSDSELAVRTVERIELGSKYFEAAEAVKTLANMFELIGNAESLPEDSVRDQYLNAVRDTQGSDFEGALDGFVGVIRKNRYYDDDGARKACIAIFKLLGEDHETTKKYRPVFASALY